MERKWEVTAVYAPLPVSTVVFQKGYGVHLGTSYRQETVSPRSVAEFKFLVVAVDGECAIGRVKRTGYFCGGLVKHFGFTAVEKSE